MRAWRNGAARRPRPAGGGRDATRARPGAVPVATSVARPAQLGRKAAGHPHHRRPDPARRRR
ncbi:hypothetical protein DK459_00675 [Achromobacter sp. RW408]|nr:hypothetical protein DK459_00675 [Achromobacter sp. RW408]